MCGFTHTFLSPSSHGKLPVCQGRCSKVSFKKVKELEFYFSPDALHIFVYIFVLHDNGIHSACRQPPEQWQKCQGTPRAEERCKS